MAQATSHPTTYFARRDAVVSTSGCRLSVDAARELRRFFLDDIAIVEARFGDSDPATADVLIARDLRLAGELRRALTTATAYVRPALRLVSA